MPITVRFARIMLAAALAAVSCGIAFAIAERGTGGNGTTTRIEGDAANGLPTGRRTYHPQVMAFTDALPLLLSVPGGATTAQFAGGRQPSPPQPV
jgi:hypothetical protein